MLSEFMPRSCHQSRFPLSSSGLKIDQRVGLPS